MKVVGIGGSNCRAMELEGDDQFNIDLSLLSQGGLSIEEAPEKLEECTKETLESADIVLSHVGACDFPVENKAQMDEKYAKYVELLSGITQKCPNAHIVVSSVPHRMNDEVTNAQIRDFNDKLMLMVESESEKMMFANNDIHFCEEEGRVVKDLYLLSDKSGVHINREGSKRLGHSWLDVIKEACYKIKLHHVWDVQQTET